jgi:hypothetical protein
MLHPTLTFAEVIQSIKTDTDNQNMIDSFQEVYGPMPDQIQEMPFWDYLCEFEPIKFRAADDFTDFDRDLFLRLTVSSFSSDYELQLNDDEELIPDLIISASSGGKSRSDNVYELFDFQTGKIYVIYVKEQLRLSIEMKERFNRETILEIRSERIKTWKERRENLLAMIEKEAARRRRNNLLL